MNFFSKKFISISTIGISVISFIVALILFGTKNFYTQGSFIALLILMALNLIVKIFEDYYVLKNEGKELFVTHIISTLFLAFIIILFAFTFYTRGSYINSFDFSAYFVLSPFMILIGDGLSYLIKKEEVEVDYSLTRIEKNLIITSVIISALSTLAGIIFFFISGPLLVYISVSGVAYLMYFYVIYLLYKKKNYKLFALSLSYTVVAVVTQVIGSICFSIDSLMIASYLFNPILILALEASIGSGISVYLLNSVNFTN